MGGLRYGFLPSSRFTCPHNGDGADSYPDSLNLDRQSVPSSRSFRGGVREAWDCKAV